MSRTSWNVVRVCLLLMAGPPIGLIVLAMEFPDTLAAMPDWVAVALTLGIPATWLVCPCVAAYFIPQQWPGIGMYYLVRNWMRW